PPGPRTHGPGRAPRSAAAWPRRLSSQRVLLCSRVARSPRGPETCRSAPCRRRRCRQWGGSCGWLLAIVLLQTWCEGVAEPWLVGRWHHVAQHQLHALADVHVLRFAIHLRENANLVIEIHVSQDVRNGLRTRSLP